MHKKLNDGQINQAWEDAWVVGHPLHGGVGEDEVEGVLAVCPFRDVAG